MSSLSTYLNTDKAYLLGLIVGGGEIVGQRLTINLPYRNWGSLRINPERGGEISEYIIRVAKPIWASEYRMDISYSVLNGSWQIVGTVTEDLRNDLKSLHLPDRGSFRELSDLAVLEKSLNNEEKLKRFIAGLTDTVGSLAPSHRHRTDSFQIISFEFAGKNFALVSQLIRIFSAIKCYPNQVLWNHPNFHSGTDRYYGSWKKGFKIRIALTDYMLAGSFVSEAKKLSAKQNLELARTALSNNHTNEVRINGRTTLHKDESSSWLPDKIKGRHFVHYTHMAYSLGAPINADALRYIRGKLENPGALVCPFTVLTKGARSEIEGIIDREEYLRQSVYEKIRIPIHYLSTRLSNPEVVNIFGLDNERGFPLNQVISAVTYVALAETESDQLMGNRIRGNYLEHFKEVEPDLDKIGVEILQPNKGTCLLVRSQRFAALVGYTDNDFNNSLIDYNPMTLTLKLKEPRFNECTNLR